MKFLKILVIISFIALGAIYIAIATLTQREPATDTITSIVLGALFIACAYGVYRDAKWGYYLSLAASAIGIAIAAIQDLPIAVAMYAALAASTLILMKKETRRAQMSITQTEMKKPMVVTVKTTVATTKFVHEKRFTKRKERIL
uniref:Uncharacterized protein n=1 Tax=Ignisphaera aggregans TaxID=334771 RepID=A0A7J2U315_9CREN